MTKLYNKLNVYIWNLFKIVKEVLTIKTKGNSHRKTKENNKIKKKWKNKIT